jgi:hypothetical protein
MDVKHSKITTITLTENDVKHLKNELLEIDAFWDKLECELKPEYTGTILSELWKRL